VLRLRVGDCLVGTVQATITEAGSVAEIAWVVGTPWQGRGLASEAAQGLVSWLGKQAVSTVVAHIHPDHRASAAVATAAGLAPTGEWQDGEVRWRCATRP
jgi:RimJ/RimL family protein N-acetyltransferase